jgi:hypothetical protein
LLLKISNLFDFPVLWRWTYVMKIIREPRVLVNWILAYPNRMYFRVFWFLYIGIWYFSFKQMCCDSFNFESSNRWLNDVQELIHIILEAQFKDKILYFLAVFGHSFNFHKLVTIEHIWEYYEYIWEYYKYIWEYYEYICEFNEYLCWNCL